MHSSERRSSKGRSLKRARSVMLVAAIATGAILSSAVAANAITSHPNKTPPKGLKSHVGPPKKVVLTGHRVTGGPIKFESNGHVSVARLWDSFNNCVEEDGTQIADLQVHAGQEDTRLGVTTVSSGWCALEQSKMHWKVTVLDSAGRPTGNTADIELSQGGFPRVLDYTWECGHTTGTMRCNHRDILGINVALGWS
jgi:hypothetical protein